jgi:hypothetical protein
MTITVTWRGAQKWLAAVVVCALVGGAMRFTEMLAPESAHAQVAMPANGGPVVGSSGTFTGGITGTTLVLSSTSSATTVTASGSTPQFICSGTGTCSWESATSAANATTAVASHTIAPTATLDANDLVLEVNSVSGGAQIFGIDLNGDVFMADGAQLCLNGPACTRRIEYASSRVYVTGALYSTGAVAIGSTSEISGIRTGTATLDFPSTAAGTCDDLTIAVTSSAVGDATIIGVPATAQVAGSMFQGWVSAGGTVSVRHCCIEGTCDPASAEFRATAMQH